MRTRFVHKKSALWSFQTRLLSCGFTLIEVLMAMGLSGLLIVTVYGAIDLTRKYSAAGQDQVERDQLGRSVLREIESDLRALIYRDSKQLLNQHVTNAFPMRMEPGVSARQDAAGLAEIGLVGDSQSLVLRSGRQSPWFSADSQRKRDNTASGGRWLAYAMAVSGQVRLPEGPLDVPSSEIGDAAKRTLDGLVQLELDAMLMEGKSVYGRSLPRVERAELLSREVADIQFRYFDGASWTGSWDSATMHGIPQAVEVTAGITDGHCAPYPDRAAKYTVGRNRYQMVIVLPLATSRRSGPLSHERSR